MSTLEGRKTYDNNANVAEWLSNRSLLGRLCRAKGSDYGSIICSAKCPNINVCEYGKEYLRRVKRGDM